MNLSAGDTILFVYDTEQYGIGLRHQLGITNAYEIRLGDGAFVGLSINFGEFDYCLNRYLDELRIFVGLLDVKLVHFAVTVILDTIAYSDTAIVAVQAKDASNADFTIPDETLLDFSLDANGELYGNLVAPDGTQAKSLAGMTYGDARAGKVKYIANGEGPDSTVKVGITVNKSDDTTIRGSDTLMVKPSIKLSIAISSPKEARPTLPDDQGGNPNDRNLIGSVVTLYKNDDPVANHNVTETARMILPSGGHDHTIQPPLNTRGVFSTVALNPETGNGTITTQTDTNGIILLNYKAPVFSGKMEFTAQTVVDSDTLSAKDTLTVKFRNLVHLPDSPENYIKIGGTCNHHGPRNDNKYPNCRTPDNNHWGHDYAVAFLQFIAIQYRTRFPDDELLQINDISLPFGGKFDIWGQWTGNVDHQYHRFGLDVDVRSRYPSGEQAIPVGDSFDDTNGNGRYDLGEPITNDVNGNGVYDRNREEFESLCLDHGVFEVDLEVNPEHYHLYFWDPPDN